MTIAPKASDQGRIPYRLWIGVTGHRGPLDEPKLAERVRRVLARIRELSPSSKLTPLRFGVVSALAEGADRLIAREVLKDSDAVLEATLPLPRAEYVRDFASQESRDEFERLLDHARLIALMPHAESREAAYAQAGRYLLERCDVVIALWDGEPSRGIGGTAEIVAGARERGVPLFCIRSSGDYEVYEEPKGRFPNTDLRECDHYNRAQLGRQLSRHVAATSTEWLAAARSVGLEDSLVRPSVDWISSHLARADILARRYQRNYFRLATGLFLFAFLAVGVAAFGRIFQSGRHEWDLLEFALLLVLLLWLLYGRYRRFHWRWLAYRSLAERLRIGFFLSLASPSRTRSVSPEYVRGIDDSRGWLRRCAEEVWMRRPAYPAAGGRAESTRRFFADVWMEGQLAYYKHAAARHLRQDRLLIRLIWALFLLTLAATFVHAIGWLHSTLGEGVLLAASSLPALAAAFSGIRAEREHVRNADRFTRLRRDLEVLKLRMAGAADDQVVRALAKAAEAVMLEEHQDWFSLMRFRELEPHV